MNILIGGSGFISNYLIKEFIDNGFNVTLIYNKTKPGLSHKNLSLLKTNLADREQVLKINNKLKKRFNLSILCAATGPEKSRSIDEMYNNNINTNKNFLEILSIKSKKIIYLSSMAIYGTISTNSVSENTKKKSISPYGKSKLDGESIMRKLCKIYKNKYFICLRLPGVVGVGVKYIFLSNVLNSILNNKKFFIRNSLQKFNNVIYVKDLSKYILSINKSSNFNIGKNVILNLASKHPIEIRYIIKFMRQFFNHKKNVISISEKKSFIINIKKSIDYGFKPRSTIGSIFMYLLDYEKINY